jgi:hypothetical protein
MQVTLAIGAQKMSKEGAIVTNLVTPHPLLYNTISLTL